MKTENFTGKKGNIEPNEKFNTSVAKLQNQMKTLKKEWRNITDKLRKVSRLAPGKSLAGSFILIQC